MILNRFVRVLSGFCITLCRIVSGKISYQFFTIFITPFLLFYYGRLASIDTTEDVILTIGSANKISVKILFIHTNNTFIIPNRTNTYRQNLPDLFCTKKPLTNVEIIAFARDKIMELPSGIEPLTCALRMRCSTN